MLAGPVWIGRASRPFRARPAGTGAESSGPSPTCKNQHRSTTMKRIWRSGRGTLPALAVITAGAVATATLAEHPGVLHAASAAFDTTTAARAMRAPTPAVAKLEDL